MKVLAMPAPAGMSYAIHPALGIARLGNAAFDPADPSTWYVGAESPYEVPNQGQPYKSQGMIKKQAQRFRIYEFADGEAQREITLQESDVVAIAWTVHLANRKAALNTASCPGTVSRPAAVPPDCFCPSESKPPVDGDPLYWPATSRNVTVPDAERTGLCIDPGPQSVDATTTRRDLAAPVTLPDPSTGTPATITVQIGTICTESGSGRLLVFAANGISQGLLNGRFCSPKITDFGNNNGWYDDTADGWVSATITFRDGTTVTLDQPQQRAWVICASPRFTPYMNWLTTLGDVAECYVSQSTPDPGRTSFRNDIYPILRSAAQVPWLSARSAVGHGPGRAGDYLTPAVMQLMADNDPAPGSGPYRARNAVFARLRTPDSTPDVTTLQQYMPQVSNDLTTNIGHHYDTAAVTPLQYARLQQWAAGKFNADGVPDPEFVPLSSLPVAQQPAALDRATLEMTAGTPFYPGIESWRIMRAPVLYAGTPLRMAASTQPGDLTIGNALPWQADYLDCNDIWWPVNRPNEVTRDGTPMLSWVPDEWMVEGKDGNPEYNRMVEGWWQLGFIVTRDNGATYTEVERGDP